MKMAQGFFIFLLGLLTDFAGTPFVLRIYRKRFLALTSGMYILRIRSDY